MQSTSSVAQGTFLFLPDGFSLAKLKKSRKRKLDEPSVQKWETAFNKVWDSVQEEINAINEELFSKVLGDLMKHLKKLHNELKLSEEVIPCEILLTGTNLPDHKLLLSAFIHNINEQITPYVASLWSWNCGNIKNTIQNFVSQVIPISKYRKKVIGNDSSEDSFDESDEDSLNDSSNNENLCSSNIRFQMSQYNLSTLSSWYDSQCQNNSKAPIVIIIPDFESFPPNILGEFILFLSSYSSKIPFILVFGVATTPVAVYQNLPRKVLSQLVIQLFKSEPSISLLNNVIENVFFSERCPFRLGSKCMTFLTDIFLFHCFSVHGFIQGFKYCLMEHFYKHNHFTLCCLPEEIDEKAEQLTEDDVERIRKLSSFQKFVESSAKEDRKALLLDDEHTMKTAGEMVKEVQRSTRSFHIALKCLHILTHDLPKSPLGRNLREYYCKAIGGDLSQAAEFKECFELLSLQSLNELLEKIKSVIKSLSESLAKHSGEQPKKLVELNLKLEEFKVLFENLETMTEEEQSSETNSFEILRKKFLDYITSEISSILRSPMNLPLHEIVYFDDLTAIRRRISGAPRGAIHLALNNPQCYLSCKCCELPVPEAIVSTLPDLSIAYKIHLQCNKMINMYDWLQSFSAFLKPDGEEAEGEINQEVQARFTRAVSELQFLGFIKPSRAKTDHVTRLTWGNS